jgi:AcrR family transcriptional regulator
VTRAADRTVDTDGAPDGLGQPAAEFLLSLPRHRHDLSREQVRASQRGRIVLATADVSASEDYADATVLAIAKRAGVSRKTFYELFADKEDALLAAYDGLDYLIEQTIHAAADSASSGGSARELLAAGTRALLATLAEQPTFTRMFFLTAARQPRAGQSPHRSRHRGHHPPPRPPRARDTRTARSRAQQHPRPNRPPITQQALTPPGTTCSRHRASISTASVWSKRPRDVRGLHSLGG